MANAQAALMENNDDTVYYDCFDLKIVYERNRTGFEETKDYPIEINGVIAGRYQVRSLERERECPRICVRTRILTQSRCTNGIPEPMLLQPTAFQYYDKIFRIERALFSRNFRSLRSMWMGFHITQDSFKLHCVGKFLLLCLYVSGRNRE
jgi:hypothetical protein